MTLYHVSDNNRKENYRSLFATELVVSIQRSDDLLCLRSQGISPIMTTMGMALEKSVYSPFSHLSWLLPREQLTEFSRR